jgi:hypothetical protein
MRYSCSKNTSFLCMKTVTPLFEIPPTRPANFEVGEALEIRGLELSNGDFHWISGYFVIVQRWMDNQWWYALTRPLIAAQLGANTRCTDPIYYPESLLRKAQVIERNPHFMSHYNGRDYWIQLGIYYRQIDLPRVSL